MTEYHVLNLGAGVQSTALYLMSMCGEVQRFDAAIFADTGEEPRDVYAHLDWLKSLGGPKILVGSAGKLGNDLMRGQNTTGRFAAIPAFTREGADGEIGRTRRQCSKEYKTEVIGRVIRREVLGLAPRRRIPKSITVNQYFGISLDEKSRASRIWERFHVTGESRYVPHFPLIDRMMTRANCIDWLARYGVPHAVPRSACVFCPFHTDLEWQRLKEANGTDWARAVEVDRELRNPGAIVNRNMNASLYLHNSCRPIDEIDFQPRVNVREQQLGFGLECEGVCGV